jgi:hypothetical protein
MEKVNAKNFNEKRPIGRHKNGQNIKIKMDVI